MARTLAADSVGEAPMARTLAADSVGEDLAADSIGGGPYGEDPAAYLLQVQMRGTLAKMLQNVTCVSFCQTASQMSSVW
jgi:hypothetical protein